jgi:hypothetical protein
MKYGLFFVTLLGLLVANSTFSAEQPSKSQSQEDLRTGWFAGAELQHRGPVEMGEVLHITRGSKVWLEKARLMLVDLAPKVESLDQKTKSPFKRFVMSKHEKETYKNIIIAKEQAKLVKELEFLDSLLAQFALLRARPTAPLAEEYIQLLEQSILSLIKEFNHFLGRLEHLKARF